MTSAYLRIKICGITDPTDGQQAALLGADAVGLNFYPPSPRFVDPERAEQILRALPPFVEAVGVFVNPQRDQVTALVQHLGRLGTIQWHGENRELTETVSYRLIPAFAVRDANSLGEITHFLDQTRSRGRVPAAILVDAYVPGQYGGTGRTAPWELLADFKPGVPILLAGGLTPDNVAEAVRIVRPYGVDVASGVERTPGRKDAEKMRRFMDNAREAAARCG